jgi:hypothetical protein
MSKSFGGNFFKVGPFSEVEETIAIFSENLYFSFLFEESIKQQMQIQEKYEEALKEADAEEIIATRNQMKLHESMMSLSLNYGFDELES